MVIVSLAVLTASSALADVRIWHTDSTTPGNLGGRAGADAICDGDTNKPSPAHLTSTRGFINIDIFDEIRVMAASYSMPTGEAVFRADGTTQVAANTRELAKQDIFEYIEVFYNRK